MGRFWGLLLAVLLPTIAFAGGPTNPPGPTPITCGGGNSVTAYTGYGQPLTCGTALNTGTIDAGTAGQIAVYSAATTIDPTTTGIGVVTALGVNVGSAGSVLVNGGVLGTPSSGTATNLTGLPIATGVSGLGTGVATALAVNVGSAGAPVVNGGALGTPSSGTLTNATGLPISTGVSGLGTGIATFLGTPTGANLTTALSSGGGTVNFLRADGSFAPPAGTTAAANPTGTAGLAAVNGVAATFMRSDAAPAVVAASTSTAGLAKLHNVPVSTGWVAGVDPNNVTIAIVNQASTISAVIGDVETATGSAATVSVVSAPSGTACSAGTVLHSGTFNANGTAATNQTLTLTTTTIAAGSRLCLQTTGTTSWTGGTGIGGITVFLAPT